MAAQGGRSGKPDEATSDTELARRLDRLSRDLEAERRERAGAVERSRESGSGGYAQAFRMSSEFIAGVVVGAVLGWGLDRLAGTSPWGLIVFLLLGFGAGVLNVLRAAGGMTASGPPDSAGGTGGS